MRFEILHTLTILCLGSPTDAVMKYGLQVIELGAGQVVFAVGYHAGQRG